jgi:hypothetical protein
VLLDLGKAYGYEHVLFILWSRMKNTHSKYIGFVCICTMSLVVSLPLEMLQKPYNFYNWSGEAGFVVWTLIQTQTHHKQNVLTMSSIRAMLLTKQKQGRI